MKTKRLLQLMTFMAIALFLISGTFIVHARPQAAIPATPSNFRVTERTTSSIKLEWDPVAGATGYTVYKYNGSTWAYYAQVGGTTYTYTDTNINCNNSTVETSGDFYKLKAFNSSGASSETGWVPPRPGNDEFNKAIAVGALPDLQEINICNASLNTAYDPEITKCNMNAGRETVWYTYTEGITAASVSFNTTGSNFDTFIAVWTGNETDYQNGALTLISCNDNAGGTSLSSLAFQTEANTTYYIEVGRYDGPAGTAVSAESISGPLASEQAK